MSQTRIKILDRKRPACPHELEFVVHRRDAVFANVDHLPSPAMAFVDACESAKIAPLKANHWWPTVHFKNFPCERRKGPWKISCKSQFVIFLYSHSLSQADVVGLKDVTLLATTGRQKTNPSSFAIVCWWAFILWLRSNAHVLIRFSTTRSKLPE